METVLGVEECVRYYPPDLSEVADPRDVLLERADPGPREIDIFLDVPFCKTICGFCPFNVYVYREEEFRWYLAAVESEVRSIVELHDLDGTRIRTVWVGGGTPSILEAGVLDSLLGVLHRHFDLAEAVEFTVEIKPTPSTLTDDKLQVLRDRGVHRVSMGVQSTSQKYLNILGRGYTPKIAYQVVDLIRGAGFPVNIDMMYRLPGQTVDEVAEDVAAVTARGIEHMSWFPYVAHGGTDLADKIARGETERPADRSGYFEMFATVLDAMSAAGYEQYTPYHFGLREGNRCQYHVDRWRMPQRETLGLGAGAFSFFNGWIYANEHDPGRYRAATESGRPPIMQGKRLSEIERVTRLAVLGTKFFVLDFDEFEQASGTGMRELYDEQLDMLHELGLIEVPDERMECTLLGKAFNNDVAAILGTDTARRTRHPQGIDLMQAAL